MNKVSYPEFPSAQSEVGCFLMFGFLFFFGMCVWLSFCRALLAEINLEGEIVSLLVS